MEIPINNFSTTNDYVVGGFSSWKTWSPKKKGIIGALFGGGIISLIFFIVVIIIIIVIYIKWFRKKDEGYLFNEPYYAVNTPLDLAAGKDASSEQISTLLGQ